MTTTTTRTLTRRERQAQTRARLLESAAKVFARDGYLDASVAEIAKRAGLSTGALYANFSGKEDLFFTLMDERMRVQAAQRRASVALAGGAGEGPIRAAAAAWVEFLETQPAAFQLLLEFWAHAQRDPDSRARVAERLAEVRERLRELIAAATEDAGSTDLSYAVQALAYGFAIQHLTDPDGVPHERFLEALELLRRGSEHAS